MGTSARIGIVSETGKIKSIIHDFDSQPESLGKILVEKYNNFERAEYLLSLGDIEFIESRHDNDGKKLKIPAIRPCSVYGQECPPIWSTNKKEFLSRCQEYDVSYAYLWENENWQFYVVMAHGLYKLDCSSMDGF